MFRYLSTVWGVALLLLIGIFWLVFGLKFLLNGSTVAIFAGIVITLVLLSLVVSAIVSLTRRGMNRIGESLETNSRNDCRCTPRNGVHIRRPR
jgi:membrane protein implicated in regulation of membrane protease activity